MAAKKADKPAKSKGKSTGSRRGGARPGAGRPPKEVTQAKRDFNAQVVGQVAEWGPELLESLKRLALGGYKRVTRKFELATLVMRDVQATDPETGAPLFNANTGAPLMTKVAAFPDAKPGAMVCISETSETADGDRAAAQYLIDRGAGKPTQAVEVSGPEGNAIPVSIEDAITKIYAIREGEECDAS